MNSCTAKRTSSAQREKGSSFAGANVARLAVGYVRASTDTQASEGLSIEAQQDGITGYCTLHEIKLVRICKDVISGAKDQGPGPQEVLGIFPHKADILVVLKFDRLSHYSAAVLSGTEGYCGR